MQTIVAFIDLLLGYVPMILVVATVLTVLWAATKLFPKFGERLVAIYNAIMGTDDEYDKKYNTGYIETHRW